MGVSCVANFSLPNPPINGMFFARIWRLYNLFQFYQEKKDQVETHTLLDFALRYKENLMLK